MPRCFLNDYDLVISFLGIVDFQLDEYDFATGRFSLFPWSSSEISRTKS